MTFRQMMAVFLVLFGSIQPGFAQAPDASLDASSMDPTLLLASTPAPTSFRVELRNDGTRDLVLNLGMELSNGKKQYPNAVEYTLTTPDGQVLHLEPSEPAVIAGRMDPLIVPLPAGAAFSFLIDLEKYVAPKEKILKLHLAPGRYTLQAKYTGRPVSWPLANLDAKGHLSDALLGRNGSCHSASVHCTRGGKPRPESLVPSP